MTNPAQPTPNDPHAGGEAAATPPAEQPPLPAPQPWSPYPQVPQQQFPQQQVPQTQPPAQPYPAQTDPAQPFAAQPFAAQQLPGYPVAPHQQAHSPQQLPQRPPQLGTTELERLYGDAPAGQPAPQPGAQVHAQTAGAPQAPVAQPPLPASAQQAAPAQPWQAQQPGAAPAPAAWPGQHHTWPPGHFPGAGQATNQFPGQFPGQLPPAGQAVAPQKKRSWIGWAIAGGGVAIVIVIALVVSLANFLRSTSDLTDALSRPGASTPAPPSAGPLTGADRPGFEAADAIVNGTYEKYSAMTPEELSQFFPNGQAGYDEHYVGAFLSLLETQTKELGFVGSITAADADLDAGIQEASDAVTELERQFLAQEHFDKLVVITLEDGTKYNYHGEYYPRGTEAFNAQREAFAVGFAPYLDANGTYVSAVNELAAGLGMQLSNNMDDFFAACPDTSTLSLRPEDLGGAYCPQRPFTIFVNEQHVNYGNLIYDPYFFDLIKHEFAHARIVGTCNTSMPASIPAGTHFEAATSSYTVLFLGGNRDLLNQSANGSADYLMTEASDHGAQLIHAGTCG